MWFMCIIYQLMKKNMSSLLHHYCHPFTTQSFRISSYFHHGFSSGLGRTHPRWVKWFQKCVVMGFLWICHSVSIKHAILWNLTLLWKLFFIAYTFSLRGYLSPLHALSVHCFPLSRVRWEWPVFVQPASNISFITRKHKDMTIKLVAL